MEGSREEFWRMLEVGEGRMRGAGARSDVTRRARGGAPVPLATARSVTRDSRPKSSKHDHELPMLILYHKQAVIVHKLASTGRRTHLSGRRHVADVT